MLDSLATSVGESVILVDQAFFAQSGRCIDYRGIRIILKMHIA